MRTPALSFVGRTCGVAFKEAKEGAVGLHWQVVGRAGGEVGGVFEVGGEGGEDEDFGPRFGHEAAYRGRAIHGSRDDKMAGSRLRGLFDGSGGEAREVHHQAKERVGEAPVLYV